MTNRSIFAFNLLFFVVIVGVIASSAATSVIV